MDLVMKARELAKAIQADTRYIAVQINRQVCDEDQDLQRMFREFNLKKEEINAEAASENRDEERMKKLNSEFRSLYGEILKNEKLTRYNEAKGELDLVVKRMTTILELAANGEDADTCDIDPASCGGNCSGCSGCN